MFGPLNVGQNEEQAKRSAHNALDAVGLASYGDENPYDLSLAERKMVAIASILAMDTDVIIFDEPTMGQDLEGKKRIKSIIRNLRKQGKLRSEEHTSELQSRGHLVCRLLLEKKKNKIRN